MSWRSYDRPVPAPGSVVRHFKREYKPEGNMYLYEIVGVAYDANSGGEVMVYRALYGEGKMYVRALTEFMSEVNRVKYPDVKQKHRFEVVD